MSPEELSDVRSLIATMAEVMRNESGVGLAANQIGDERAVFILGIEDEAEAFINPEIVEQSNPVEFDEGCLSIPGAMAKTKRNEHVRLKFMSADGQLHEQEFHGLKAFAVQHEMDHLAGKLYIDQFGPTKKLLVVDKHKKFLKLSKGK